VPVLPHRCTHALLRIAIAHSCASRRRRRRPPFSDCLASIRSRRPFRTRAARRRARARGDGAAGGHAGEDLDDADVDQMVEKADVDKDGQISYEEFVKLLMPQSMYT
jgi:hypothetical protein